MAQSIGSSRPLSTASRADTSRRQAAAAAAPPAASPALHGWGTGAWPSAACEGHSDDMHLKTEALVQGVSSITGQRHPPPAGSPCCGASGAWPPAGKEVGEEAHIEEQLQHPLLRQHAGQLSRCGPPGAAASLPAGAICRRSCSGWPPAVCRALCQRCAQRSQQAVAQPPLEQQQRLLLQQMTACVWGGWGWAWVGVEASQGAFQSGKQAT